MNRWLWENIVVPMVAPFVDGREYCRRCGEELPRYWGHLYRFPTNISTTDKRELEERLQIRLSDFQCWRGQESFKDLATALYASELARMCEERFRAYQEALYPSDVAQMRLHYRIGHPDVDAEALDANVEASMREQVLGANEGARMYIREEVAFARLKERYHLEFADCYHCGAVAWGATYSPGEASRARSRLWAARELEGCLIVAQDGQSLGVIAENASESDSIINDSGRYGSEWSETCIFNTSCKYHSEKEPDSPFNKRAVTPPRIFSRSGQFIAYLTLNKALTPAVNPWGLHVLRRNPTIDMTPELLT